MKSRNAPLFGLASTGCLFLLTAGQVGAQLVPPAGNMLSLSVFGAGFQDYTSVVDPNNANAFVWNFVAPDARLFTDTTQITQVGTHFAGPTWQSDADGSSVVGLRIASLASSTPNSIPQLLLSTASHSGTGIFSDVSYIQRLDTSGGIAPIVPPTALRQVSDVPYTATYRFFKPAAVPEPGSVAMLAASGLCAAGVFARRRCAHQRTQLLAAKKKAVDDFRNYGYNCYNYSNSIIYEP